MILTVLAPLIKDTVFVFTDRMCIVDALLSIYLVPMKQKQQKNMLLTYDVVVN